MPVTPEPARLVFSNWFASAGDPGATHWANPLDWHDLDSIQRVIEGLAADINHRWKVSTENFTHFAATVIADLCPLEARISPGSISDVLAFIRFFAASAALLHATTHGRSNLIYNWLFCTISDLPYHYVEPGVAIDHLDLKVAAIGAAAQLAAWLNQTGEPEVRDIAVLLASTFDLPGMTSSPAGVKLDDIRTWGSPVFYE